MPLVHDTLGENFSEILLTYTPVIRCVDGGGTAQREKIISLFELLNNIFSQEKLGDILIKNLIGNINDTGTYTMSSYYFSPIYLLFLIDPKSMRQITQ